MRTKKIVIGLMGLVAFAVSVPQVHAWICWRRCCCKYSTYICCRPYNAFTPVCYGSICCNGCCPMQFSCGSGGPCCPQPCCGPSMVSQGCCEADLGPAHMPYGPQPILQPAPGPGPNWVPPGPTPMVSQAPAMWNYSMPQQVQQTSYYPGYYPSYQPQGYWPTMPAFTPPSYWYGR